MIFSPHNNESVNAEENSQVLQRYKKRAGLGSLYSPFKPDVVASRQEWERGVIQSLLVHGVSSDNVAKLRVLDVGCGHGAALNFFLALGCRPENLAGIDLIAERIEAASSRLPSQVILKVGDIVAEAMTGKFDVINTSVVLSSILNETQRRAVANRMLSLLAENGCIILYDFFYNNSKNRDVKKLTISQIRDLFPGTHLRSRRMTLAPPIARRVTRLHPTLYSIFNFLPLLRTHRLTTITRSPK